MDTQTIISTIALIIMAIMITYTVNKVTPNNTKENK